MNNRPPGPSTKHEKEDLWDPFALSPDEKWKQKQAQRRVEWVMERIGPRNTIILAAVLLVVYVYVSIHK